MKVIVDIEASNLLGNALDYTEMPFKLKDDFNVWCVVIRNAETNAVTSLYGKDLTKVKLKDALEGATEVIGHNIINYDAPVLQLYGLWDYRIGYPGEDSILFGKPCKFTDTLLWSKLLNADRFGGHSLDAWGKRLGNHKGDFNEWHRFSQEMLEYCIQDTAVNLSIYKKLVEEQGDHNWSKPYSMEVKLADLALKRELFGMDFDVQLAHNNIKELTEIMQNIAVKVDPLLPDKQMPKTEYSSYIPPKVRFKKNGEVSSHMQKFLEKHNAKLTEDFQTILFEGKKFSVSTDKPLKSTTKATIEDIDVVKGYLLSLGWRPTEVKERDLVKNTDKTVKNQMQIEDAIERYVKQTEVSLFKELRLDHLGVPMQRLKDFLMKKIDGSKPIYVPTTPKLSVGVEKEICPNLILMGEKAEFVKDVVHYYTYRHRKNSIAGGVLDEDGEPETGFLSAVRDDGRVPTPADTLGANTGRYRHKIVCNIPRVTSLYGEQMRNLFGSGKGLWQIGFDFASLEARIMGHHVMPYTDGEALAEALIAEKPNDIHCYREDTEILTETGWKTFGMLQHGEKVAQFKEGSIEFVVPSDIIWKYYEGVMLNDPVTKFSVTPNHRVYYESYTAKKRGKIFANIVDAESFKPSSDKRYVMGGYVTNPEFEELSDTDLQLLVATQADGYLDKDNAGIQFTFVKERKISRMKRLLKEAGVSYGEGIHNRKERDEIKLRLPSGAEVVKKIRDFLTESKGLSSKLYKLSARQINIVLDEVEFWDGTLTNKGDVVLDTTSKETVDVLQTLCSLANRKCLVSQYQKTSTFGDCLIYRAYISKKTTANYLAASKNLEQEDYAGFIGCVSVPSGLLLVRREGVTVISGNSINARKLGIDRSAAKSFSYAAIYGAQPKKLSKMVGVSETEGKRLFNEYWEAVPALKELKQRVEKYWETHGKTYIPGLDGRLLFTRSKHSLINVLFQSGGAIAAKWTTVNLARRLENLGLLGDPLVHSKKDVKVWLMIEMHDEVQMAVHPSLLDVKTFDTEEEAKQTMVEGCSAIGHGRKGAYVGYKTQPVECIAEAIKDACKELKLKVDLGFEWIPGLTWGQCH